MPKTSVGFYLVAMVCTIAVPILAFVALLLSQLETNERAQLERRTEREAQLLSTAVAQVLQEMSTTLKVLATSPELEAGDLPAFHRRAQAALQSGSLFSILVREDGQQLLNTRVPHDTELGRMSNMASLEEALQSGKISVSDVFVGGTSERWVFNVTMPLPDRLKSRGAALIMTKDADELVNLATTQGLPTGWSTALIDGAGNLVASSSPLHKTRGKPLEDGLLPELRSFSGVGYAQSGSTERIVGFARVWGWSWTAVVWGPVAAAQAPILITWQRLIFGGLALLAVALTAAVFLARRLRGSVTAIADMANRLGRGEIVPPAEVQIIEVGMVAAALSTASRDRREAEDRIHLMLGELAHRTKNLLTVIQALIHQTSRRSETVADFQIAIAERLGGLGKSIDLLTNRDWSGIPIRNLLETHLSTFLASPGQLRTTGEDFLLKPGAVQDLGLVLHELATNAVKYGALSVPEGNILVEWKVLAPSAGEPELVIEWLESGGPGAEQPANTGFGSQILEKHAASAFDGAVVIDYGSEGFHWTLTGPYSAFADADTGARSAEGP